MIDWFRTRRLTRKGFARENTPTSAREPVRLNLSPTRGSDSSRPHMVVTPLAYFSVVFGEAHIRFRESLAGYRLFHMNYS